MDWSAVAIVGVAVGGGGLTAWKTSSVTRRHVEDQEKLTEARLSAVKSELEDHRRIQADQRTALDAHHKTESDRLESLLGEWRELSTELKVMLGQQAIINQTTAGALTAVTDKLERQERLLSSHETSIEVLKSQFKGKI